jgi:hypothetical protein
MKRSWFLALAAILTAPASWPRALAEEVEHPIYRSWARYPVGTTVTMRSVADAPGTRPIETTTILRLVELTDEKAVVEQVVVSDATGSKSESEPQRFSHRRMFPLLGDTKKEDIGKPRDAVASGEERVRIGGRDYQAVWFDTKGRTEAGEARTRIWLSDEVPGRLLKSVTEVPAAQKTTTLELVEIKRP